MQSSKSVIQLDRANNRCKIRVITPPSPDNIQGVLLVVGITVVVVLVLVVLVLLVVKEVIAKFCPKRDSGTSQATKQVQMNVADTRAQIRSASVAPKGARGQDR